MRRFLAMLSLLGFASLAGAAVPERALSGPYRGPANNGIYPDAGLLKSWPPDGPALLWKAKLGEGYSSVAVAQGTVYGEGYLEVGLKESPWGGEDVWSRKLEFLDMPLQRGYFYDQSPPLSFRTYPMYSGRLARTGLDFWPGTVRYGTPGELRDRCGRGRPETRSG